MSSEREPQYREVARRLREELARIRTSEAQVEQALAAVRGARRRVEELAISLEREEDRVREVVREELHAELAKPGAPPAKGRVGPAGLPWRSGRESAAAARAGDVDGPAVEVARGERRRLALVASVAVLTVVLVGWLAFEGLRDGVPTGPLVLSPDRPVGPLGSAPAADGVAAEEAPPPAASAAAGPLAALPPDPRSRVQLYDSLFLARSSLFEPLLDSVIAVSDDGDVDDAARAWSGEDDLTPKQNDLIHSAIVQWILKREIDQRVEVDGELLRNPCRGTSCSALLNLWQMGRAAYGFPPIPDDAPTNVDALRTVEAMLVLERMQDLRPSERVASSGARR